MFDLWKRIFAKTHSLQALSPVVLAALLFLCILSGAASAQTVTSNCSACTGPGGTVVSVTLSGWAVGSFAGVDVFAVGGGAFPLASCPASNPNCTVQVTMPPDALTYHFFAQSGSINATSSTTFTVLPPSFTMQPTCGGSGTSVAITGQQFAPNNTVDIYFGVADNILLGTATTDANGNFTQTVTMQAGPTGPVTVAGPDALTVENTFTQSFCPRIGQITQLAGVVTDNGVPLSAGGFVNLDDTIITGANAKVLITFDDNSQITLTANSKIVLDQYVYNSSTNQGGFFYSLAEGAFQYLSGLIGHTTNNEKIQTGLGSIGIRGTQFILWPGTVPNSLELDLLVGSVAITPNQTDTTTVFTAPVTIVYNATGTTTSSLTTDQYNAILNTVFPPPSMDTTPPKVTVTFPTPPAPQNGWFNATSGQVPVSGSVTATDASNVTKIVCSDSLSSGFIEGVLMGGGTATASQTLSASANGTNSISCTATDGAGNVGAAMGSANTATVKIDTVPPAITGAAAPPANAYGWNNTSVTVTFTCSDAISGIASCTAPVVLSTQGTNLSAQGTAIDNAGNSSQTTVSGIKLETAPPAVTYTGNAATYNVNQTVNITCVVTPSLAPITTNTCANISGAAYSFGLGAHPYSASASDQAGNTGMGNTSFTVVLNFTGLIGLVNQFATKAGVSSLIVADIQGAQASFSMGIITAGDNQLSAAINLISAQSGKSLTTAQSGLLIQYLQALMM